MPLLRVNANASGIFMHDTSRPVAACLRAVRARSAGPAVIMVHGYKYAPSLPQRCPHKKIFGFGTPHSWPEGLNLEERGMLGIAFGWSARGPLRTAAAEAEARGQELARLVRLLRLQGPERPVHVIAHSLGATLVLSALQHLQSGDVGRIVLLAGAAQKQAAEKALRTPAGASAAVLNMTSRENDLFDFAFERLVRRGPALAAGIEAPNALTIQIDCPHTLQTLEKLGHPIAAPARRVCHWSTYTRSGMLALHAALLDPAGPLTPARLKVALPFPPSRRWSRLRPRLPSLAALIKTRIMGARSSKSSNHEHAY